MAKDRMPQPGQIYNHFKNKLYQIITLGYDAESGEEMVVYQALYGEFRTYIRTLRSFMSEVDHVKYPEVTQKYRFELRNLREETATGEDVNKLQITEAVEAGCKEKAGCQEGADEQSREAAAPVAETEVDGVNSVLLQFLDADSFYKKLEVLTSNRKHLNDRIINDMAVSLDCTVEEGPLEDRIQGLIFCLQALCRFEDKRLR